MKITVSCPNSTGIDADAWGAPNGIGISNIILANYTPTGGSGFIVVDRIRVDCACANALIAKMRANDTWFIYCIGIRDCRTYARDRFLMFASDCFVELE